MKSIIVTFLLLVLGLTVQAQCNKINFVNASLSYASSKARYDDKGVFVFLYEQGDNKANFIERAIFYKNEVCESFNDRFINLKAKTNSMVGKELIQKHQIKEFPSFVLLDKYGNLLDQSSTIKNTSELLDFAIRRVPASGTHNQPLTRGF